jgi:alpha-galactosidase
MKILFMGVLLLWGSAASANNDSLLTMDFGKANKIVYSLQTGSYEIIFDGRVTMKASANSAYIKYTKTSITGGALYTIERTGLKQLFYIYPGKSYFFVQAQVDSVTNYIPVIKATVDNTEGLVVPFDNDMWVRYQVQPGNFTSSEVTALLKEGIVIGSIEHTTWKTGIKVQNKELEVFAGFTDSLTTHDIIPHGKAGNTSPKIMIGHFKDWRDGMEQYALCNKLAEPPVIKPWKKATPIGWNSWGALQTKLNLQNAKGVIDFLKDSCKAFRNAENTLYIDLDSYWDNMNNEQLKEFVVYCKKYGFKPGIYWAPFADWGKQFTATWLLQNGQPVNLDGAYAMDPTHPSTKDRIKKFISRFKELGFEMIKIDFLGHAALESERFYNPKVTTGMQAFAEGMAYLDSMMDNSMLVYAAISPTMATARYVHMRRIACDAFSAIDNTEYTLNSTGYGWWQANLYAYIDADHVVFNRESAGANRARLASALVTGTLITGDDFSTDGPWRQAAKQLLQNKPLLSIIKDGKPFRPIRAATGKQAPDLFMKGNRWLAVFNYDKSPKSIHLPLPDGTLIKELFTLQTYKVTATVPIEIPPADVRLFEIAPAKKG